MLPSIASAFALFLLFIIGLSFSNFSQNENNSSDLASSSESSGEEILSDKLMENKEISDASMETESMNLAADAVYQDDVGDREVLTYPIPDENVQVLVPISILVSNPDHLSKFDLYKQHIEDVINQTNGDLSDYLPIDPSTFTYDSEQKIVQVNLKDNISNFGSHSEEFFHTLVSQQLETIGAVKMAFYTKGNEGAILGNRVETEIDYKPLENRGYFLLESTMDEEKALYVPFEKPFESIDQALDAMKNNIDTHGLVASIPDTINIAEITEDRSEKQLIIRLSNGSKLEENRRTINAIESILLTAKDFNFSSVKFENTNIKEVGEFILTDKLLVPIAANKMDL